ncbi:MAG: 2-succinyl-5-enolpyruvyl-6-hydroxy-3-cyclohexene-1-carboxylic-acid synthase [Actinobacteria bacterium]|nr:2-succinyl-5-enolpyruvyl-6-hydroxy-3-cyclohexene-1-carboxylic-acid synthase [Actinomycetota bacterium]
MSAGLSFCRTLVDEWRRAGVTDAVISPGSRSTPLAVALAEALTTHVILDERCASFTALGAALASGRPTVLACTSGTAPMHLHAAVVEADQAGVPLIVCTADRPAELIGVGAPQTSDQTHVYGRAVRWFAEPGPPDVAMSATWRSLASRAFCEATGPRPGPVHLNLAFREPFLDGPTPEPPPGRSDGAPWHRAGDERSPRPAPTDLAEACAASTRPLVISGHDAPAGLTLDAVPVLSDHRGAVVGTVAHWDLLVRSPTFRDDHRPDLIVSTGMPPASKALATWLASLDVPRVVLAPGVRWIDPAHRATWMLRTPTVLSLRGEPGWAEGWRAAGDTAGAVVDDHLAASGTLTEPGVARLVLTTRASGSTVVVSSSMPIRDLETFGAPRPDVRVLANRGVNGIDGVVSTALGVALTGAPTTLVIGDLALLHDQGSLTGLAERGVDLTIVVVDNRGGGIFSFLPQRDQLDDDRFEALFGTPQAADPVAIISAHGIECSVVATTHELAAAANAAGSRTGVRAIVARSDRSANRTVHEAIVDAVIAAIGR